MRWSAEEVREAVAGRVPPAPTSLAYRAGLASVALLMAVLPLLYLGLAAAIACGMLWWVRDPLSMWTSRLDWRLALIGYAGPLFGGAVLLWAMLRAVFPGRDEAAGGRTLRDGEEPVLRAFADAVADAVGAPRAAEIRVDLDVNASASFRRGWRSLLLGRDLVLTIGLPLAGGLDARQFAGVLAHEFGHFGQGAGMRCGYLVRSVNAWFARVAFEPAGLAKSMREASRGGWFVVAIFAIGAGFEWVARRVLRGIMYVGHAASCNLSRAMELDADRSMVHVAGTASVPSTVRRLVELSNADRIAFGDVVAAFGENRIPDDHCELVRGVAAAFGPDVHRAIDRMQEEGRTRWNDTHPADKDRVAAALREAAPGFARIDGPATALFGDFEALSRELTEARYAAWLGTRAREPRRVPAADVLAVRGRREATSLAADRYFRGSLTRETCPSPSFDPAAPAPDAAAARAAIARGRDAVGDEALRRRAEREAELDRVGGDAFRLRLALTFVSAGFAIDAKALRVPTGQASVLRSTLAAAESDLAARRAALAPEAIVQRERLEAALSLLRDSAVRADAERGEERLRRLTVLAPVLHAVASVRDAFEIDVELAVVAHAFGSIDGSRAGSCLRDALHEICRGLRVRLTAVRPPLSVPYPYDHGRSGATVLDHVFGGEPASIVLPDWVEWATEARRRLLELEYRVLTEVVETAEAAETALGFAPLFPPSAATAETRIEARPLHR